MSRPRRSALALATALLALAAPGSAIAQGDGVSINQAGSPDFPQRAYSLHVPERTFLDADEVTVTENGDPVRSTAVASAAASGESFGTVLVVDASDSMQGAPIAEAMRAARAFAGHRNPGQRLGVVTFNEAGDVLLPLTSDQGSIDDALSESPVLASSTHVYDALDIALAMLDDSGVEAGSIVVLSDGADTGSVTTEPEVIARAESSRTRIFAVGLRSEAFDPATLEGLAVGGTFVEAKRPADLAAILERFGAQLAAEFLLRYESEGEAGESLTVEVTVEGIEGTARDFYKAPSPGGSGDAKQAEEGFWRSTGAMLGAIALAAALLGLALLALVRPRPETARDRLLRFLKMARPEPAGAADRRYAAGLASRLGPIERSLSRRPWWTRLNEALDVAGIETPAIRIAAVTVAGTVLAVLFFGAVIDAPILIPLALLVPVGVRSLINRALRKQRDAFAEDLGDNLQLVASALRAGQSMAGALAVVTEEASEPTRGEFRRIINDERLGVPLDDAVRDVARRMDNRDMEQVALVATIQRETGGNTAEVLDQVIETIRERDKLRRLMRTLTAQGRLAQVIVSLMPLALFLIISIIRPDYLDPLFETSGGNIALAIGAGLSVTGSLIIKRIVEIRV